MPPRASREALFAAYRALAVSLLEGGGEPELYQASQLAREHIGVGLGPQDMSQAHAAALDDLLRTRTDLPAAAIARRLSDLLLETMVVYGEAHQLVKDVLATLEQSYRELAETKRELQRSHAFVANVLRSMCDSLVVTDASGTITAVNPPTLEWLGYREHELLGKPAALLFAPGAPTPFAPETIAALASGASPTARDATYRTRSGRDLPVSFSASPMLDGGALSGIVGVARDTSEVRRLIANLERSNRELEHFAYVASHDLQEPLRMVSSFTQLLARRYQGKLDAEADDFIGFAVDGANRMQRLIIGLLEYSRVETRGQPPAPTDARTALEGAMASLGLAIAEAHACITVDRLPTVVVDPVQLEQVFQNLLANALKFRDSGPPRIHVAAEREGAMWRLSVADNGIGIDPEHRARLFKLFQRLHAGSRYPGTGIGLAICKRIVERHGGRIWVDSEPGQGATFCFTLRAPAP